MFQILNGVSFLNIIAILLPGIIILFIVCKIDKEDKESAVLLALLLFLGMLSAFLTMKIGSPIATHLSKTAIGKHWTFMIINSFFITALLEEGLKYLSLKIPTWNNSIQFDYRFDGIVYGSFVGVGFAIYEALTFGGHESLTQCLKTSIMSASGHFTYGVIMGLLIAEALYKENQDEYSASKRLRLLAFAIPWLIHGSFDFVADLINIGALPLSVNYLFALVELIIAVIIVVVVSRKDRSVYPEKKAKAHWWKK